MWGTRELMRGVSTLRPANNNHNSSRFQSRAPTVDPIEPIAANTSSTFTNYLTKTNNYNQTTQHTIYILHTLCCGHIAAWNESTTLHTSLQASQYWESAAIIAGNTERLLHSSSSNHVLVARVCVLNTQTYNRVASIAFSACDCAHTCEPVCVCVCKLWIIL